MSGQADAERNRRVLIDQLVLVRGLRRQEQIDEIGVLVRCLTVTVVVVLRSVRSLLSEVVVDVVCEIGE
jgi:hypothetical protein